MKEEIYSFKESDPRMGAAMEEARRTLRTFFNAYVAPKPNQRSFLLKVLFEVDGEREHIWVADINASVFPLQGVIANEPRIDGFSFMQQVSFHPSKISDWMFIEDGYLVGGFTTQVIRSGLSPAEKEEYDASAPYKFR
jgi:uncharacterized protein YegJ (DUF2314 family)